jgi:TPR repeat protein
VAHNDTRVAAAAAHVMSSARPAAAMDSAARRRACVAFRVKPSLDTGLDLSAAVCEELLGLNFTCKDGEEVSLQSNPGRFYVNLGEEVAARPLDLDLPNHMRIAWWCYREAADIHKHPGGMRKLAWCYNTGRGVTEDPAQAVAWYQKAADVGDAASKAKLGSFLVRGCALAGVVKDTARGLALLREAVEQGFGAALYFVECYLTGEGVEKDAVHRVSLLRQVITQDAYHTGNAQTALARCYVAGDGVEAALKQAAKWSSRAAAGGNAEAIQMLETLRMCDFCGTHSAAKLWCERCRKVRYCDRQCQLAHWNHAINPHKGPCKEHRRRAAEASQQEAGGASTSAHH